MAEVNGDLIVLKVRENGSGDPFRQIICTDSVTLDISSDVSKRKTSCGIKTSIADPDVSVTGSGVYETTQLGTQISWDDIFEWQKTKTKVDFMFLNLASADGVHTEGSAVSVIGSGFFANSSFTGSAEDGSSTFDFTLEGTGTLDSYDV